MTLKDQINSNNNRTLRKVPGKFILSFFGKKKSRLSRVMRWIGAKCDCCGMGPNYVPVSWR